MKFRFPSFWKKVSVVLFGTVMSQMFPLLLLPLITRVLSQQDVGYYFTWLGGVLILAVVTSLRLDMAVFQVKTNRAAISVVHGLIIVLAVFFAISLAAGFLLEPVFQRVSDFSFLWLISGLVAASFLGLNLVVNSIFSREGSFKRQAKWKIILGGVTALSQLIVLQSGFGVEGLILAHAAAVSMVSVLMAKSCGVLGHKFFQLRLLRVSLLRVTQCRRYVFVSMPAALVNTTAAYLPLFLITGRLGPMAAGQFGLTQRVIAAPLGLVGSSIVSVFRQEVSETYRGFDDCLPLYLKTLRSLAFVALVPFALLAFFGPEIFLTVFGDEWRQAGVFAQILAPFIFLRFIASPLSYMLFLANRQYSDLLWQVILLVLTAGIFLMASDIDLAVILYSAIGSVMYSVNLLMSYKVAKGSASRT